MTTPFMQLWVADYLGDTKHLTTEQHGAYLLLLMTMWRADGSLPADDAKLARIVGLTVGRWNKIKGDIVAMLTIEDGRVTQKRLSTELKKAQEKSAKCAEAGRKGGRPKSLNENDAPKADGYVPLKQSEPEPKPEAAAVGAAAHSPSETSDQINRLNRILGFDERDFGKHAENIRVLVDLKTLDCDFERHILPAAQAVGARSKNIRSLNYIREKAFELRDAAKLVASMPAPFENTDEPGWAGRMRAWRDKALWSPKWGPTPDEAGCKCPDAILHPKEAA